MANINGNSGNNNLPGTNNNDVILGKQGDDTIDGKDGNDFISGDAKTVSGAWDGSKNFGDDSLDGGAGHDTIYGDGGDDTIRGGEGADKLVGDWTTSGGGYGCRVTGDDVFIVDEIGHGYGDKVFGGGLAQATIGGWGDDDDDGGSHGWGDDDDDGGSTVIGSDFDILDLTGSTGNDVLAYVTGTSVDDEGNGEDGQVVWVDSHGNELGRLKFDNIEEIKGGPGFVDDDPLAFNDAATTNEETPVTVNVLANDIDPDGGPLSVIGASGAVNGLVTVNPDNTITYTPNADFNGNETITYTIKNSKGETDTATLTVNVKPVNDPPVAKDDTATTDEDTTVVIDVLSNDSDPDGDPLSVQGTPTANNGSVSVNGDGTISYTPDTGFNGTDTITYTVSDGQGGTDTATVKVTVAAVNDAPIAKDDSASTDEDTPVTIDVLGNDSDPDGDPLSIQGTPTADNGTVSVNPDGTITYTPDPDYNGPDTISYTVTDGNGGTDTGTVKVNVKPVNDAPIAKDDSASTDEDTPVVVDLLGNDSDPDGDPLSFQGTPTADNGSISINPDGTVTYTPDPDFTGTDTISYTVTDGNGGTDTGTAKITVGAVNDAPIAKDDSATTDEDTPVTIDVLGNDSDPDGDPLSIQGTPTADNGTVSVNPDGTITYTPDPDYNGPDTISYTVTDGNGGTDTGTVKVNVKPVNDAPIAKDDTATTDEDTPVTIDVLGNDSDPDGDPLSIQGTPTADNGTVSVNPDGTITYTPDLNYSGTDTITYTVTDGNGGTDTAQVKVSVADVNSPPDAVDDTATTDEDTLVNIKVLDNDSDPDGDPLTVTDATAPNGTVAIKPDGSLDYTPAPDFSGTDTITYDISDGKGGTDTATVSVTVKAMNDMPNAVDDSAVTDEDVPVTIDVLSNDTDPEGDPLSINGTPFANNGTVAVNPDGTLTYTPDPDFNGTDTIVYGISDGNGGTDTGAVTVTVNPINDAPDAVDDKASTTLNTPVTIDVLANDTDPDNDPLQINGTPTALNGSVAVNPDGSIDYTPNDGFIGSDQITYSITDGNGGFDTAIVNVAVPCFVRGTQIATMGGSVSVEDLKVGDKVITRDNGLQEIRWIGSRKVLAEDKMAPVKFEAGALGANETALWLSPNHRVLNTNWDLDLLFDTSEVLIAAKHMVGQAGVSVVSGGEVEYFHILFDNHQVILSNGVWTESFHPGDVGLSGFDEDARQEIFYLFPELMQEHGLTGYGGTVRTVLKAHEVLLLEGSLTQ